MDQGLKGRVHVLIVARITTYEVEINSLPS
jgi:hypothetical protein